MPLPVKHDPLEILSRYWGYPAFRPLQEDIIRGILNGKDTLALLPTGGGKSLCYQVPALCTDGVCLVISPLIALMKDQVSALRKRSIAAAAIFSGMRSREIDGRLDAAAAGHLKMLYLSPERLITDKFLGRLDRMPVSLIAVDEAHCISEWGHDFRPSYLRIQELREHLQKHGQNVPVLALTASATPEVKAEIASRLALRSPAFYQASFARTNLHWIVRQTESKKQRLVTMFSKIGGTGLVYTKSRRRTRELAELLQGRGISSSFYHAGLDAETREARQDGWMKGNIRVMVCTNAFGMGIDKPDVRLVAHYDAPDSLEAYYQEAGRAGRDGKPCWAGLLVDQSDLAELARRRDEGMPDLAQVRQLYQQLADYSRLAIGSGLGETVDFDPVAFARHHKTPSPLMMQGLRILAQEGWIALNESVWLPARARMLAGREDLYRFQIENKTWDPLIKALQRSTPGLHDHYAVVDEKRLARTLDLPVADVMRGLLLLREFGLLDYQPRQEHPQLTWLRPRADARTLPLDAAHLRWRLERHKERLQAVIDFATAQDGCRSALIQAYFGEQAEPCGQCDLCRERSRHPNLPATIEALRLLLAAEALRPAEAVERMRPRQEKEVLQALRWLQDRGELRRAAGNALIWRP